MKRQIATATKLIHAPADKIYKILADYRTKHPRILPKPYFLSLDVEEGGVGEGTIVNFKMYVLGRSQSFRSLITEPVPGRALLETDLHSGVVTRFDLSSLEGSLHTQVTISTELQNQGWIQGWLAKFLLQKIYRQELELLADLAEHSAELAPSITPGRER